MAGDLTITYDTTSSDTVSNASGCGPATAITGSNAISGDGAGGGTQTVIDLSGDTPDLSGVQVGDILLIVTSSASDRSLFEITAVDDTADTVTVASAPTTAINTGSALAWAIGGKRPSLVNHNSRGDYWEFQPGWIAEMTAGQTFTTQASSTSYSSLNPSRTDVSPHHTVFRSSTEGTRYTIQTPSAGRYTWGRQSAFMVFDCHWDNQSNVATTGQTTGFTWTRCKFSNSGTLSIALSPNIYINCLFDAWDPGSEDFFESSGIFPSYQFISCRFDSCATVYFEIGQSARTAVHWFVDCEFFGTPSGAAVEIEALENNEKNSEDGGVTFLNCTFYDIAGDGIKINPGTKAEWDFPIVIRNCSFVNCGGYGVNFTTLGDDVPAYRLLIDYNHFHNNTSGDYSDTGLSPLNDISGAPVFTSTTSGSEDFTPDTGSPLIDAAETPGTS